MMVWLKKWAGRPFLESDSPSVLKDCCSLLEMQNLIPAPQSAHKVYIASLGQDAVIEGIKIQHLLRSEGVIAEMDLQDKSLKGQMKQAGKSKADFAIIIGSNELEEKAATVKNMNNGEQKQVPFDNVAEYILSALKNN